MEMDTGTEQKVDVHIEIEIPNYILHHDDYKRSVLYNSTRDEMYANINKLPRQYIQKVFDFMKRHFDYTVINNEFELSEMIHVSEALSFVATTKELKKIQNTLTGQKHVVACTIRISSLNIFKLSYWISHQSTWDSHEKYDEILTNMSIRRNCIMALTGKYNNRRVAIHPDRANTARILRIPVLKVVVDANNNEKVDIEKTFGREYTHTMCTVQNQTYTLTDFILNHYFQQRREYDDMVTDIKTFTESVYNTIDVTNTESILHFVSQLLIIYIYMRPICRFKSSTIFDSISKYICEYISRKENTNVNTVHVNYSLTRKLMDEENLIRL
jgi:hypothetical protein